MKQIIPYEKEISFGVKIAEISSISLEEGFKIKEDEILGEFIVSGEYKTHEISVNRESFLYKLPFSVTLTDNIDINSVNLEIKDFYYDVIKENVLKVNIEFEISADEIEDVREIEEEKEDFIVPFIEPEEENIRFDDIIDNKDEETRDVVDNQMILNSAVEKEDSYVTYHVHIVREDDTLESICQKYNSNIDTIKSINNMSDISLGDKIIIPENNGE